MEVDNKLYDLAERAKLIVPQIKTEEATKQSLILPLFQILGYDVFNPLEFCPEFTADVGIKKGEKVDYTILIDGNPLILIEAKGVTDSLTKHGSQLFRYFATTSSKFGILTNGIVYKFFTDLDEPNKMDSKPFFEFNLFDLSEQSISYLEHFMKNKLSVEDILSSASDLKYVNLIKNAFKETVENPSDIFIKMLLSDIYEGQKNQTVIDKFRPIIKRSINQFINEKMSSKFKQTLKDSDNDSSDTDDEPEDKIVTTFDELNAYAVIKSILRKEVNVKRIAYKDTESYFGVLLDKNTRKWLCRVEFKDKSINLYIPDEDKKPVRYPIQSIDDIYDYSDAIVESLRRYL